MLNHTNIVAPRTELPRPKPRRLRDTVLEEVDSSPSGDEAAAIAQFALFPADDYAGPSSVRTVPTAGHPCEAGRLLDVLVRRTPSGTHGQR